MIFWMIGIGWRSRSLCGFWWIVEGDFRPFRRVICPTIMKLLSFWAFQWFWVDRIAWPYVDCILWPLLFRILFSILPDIARHMPISVAKWHKYVEDYDLYWQYLAILRSCHWSLQYYLPFSKIPCFWSQTCLDYRTSLPVLQFPDQLAWKNSCSLMIWLKWESCILSQ